MECMELHLSLSHNSHVKCKLTTREVTLACTWLDAEMIEYIELLILDILHVTTDSARVPNITHHAHLATHHSLTL